MAVIVTFDITLLLLFLFPLTDGYVFMFCCLKQHYFIATGYRDRVISSHLFDRKSELILIFLSK